MTVKMEKLLQNFIFNNLSVIVIVRCLGLDLDLTPQGHLLSTCVCSFLATYVRCETVNMEVGVFAGIGLNLCVLMCACTLTIVMTVSSFKVYWR